MERLKDVMYFSFVFHAITQLHIDHLQSVRYARHIALQEAYEGLTELLDQLIEVRQGESEILFKGYKLQEFKDDHDSISYLERFIQKSLEYREHQSTNVQNTIDEIISLGQRTIYKLKFLQ